MPGIGDTLREARMRQGLEIADMEAQTKIRAKYLRALENEEFSMLPGSTFVRTFLRTYAEKLGLDPHLLIDEYRASYDPTEEAETASLGPATQRQERLPRRVGPGGPPRPAAIVGLAAVAVLALLLVLGLTGGSDNSKQSAQTNTAPKKKAKPKKKPEPVPTSVTLRVQTQFPTYACVDTGAGTTVVYQGTIDGSRTFKGKRLRVNLGKTSVKLTANGKSVPVVQSPNPAGFEFTPKGHKDLPVGQRPCA